METEKATKQESKAGSMSQRPRNIAKRYNQPRTGDQQKRKRNGGARSGREGGGEGGGGSVKPSVRIKDFRARYWSYLFENFHRAVDEIYSVCEQDESEIECQEMIMMLEVCKKDFESLIQRFKMQREYARKGEGRSLAWDVRKSPSKGHGTFEAYLAKQQVHEDATDPAHLATPTGQPKPLPISPPSVKTPGFGRSCSWADKVRGYSIEQGNQSDVQHGNQSDVQHGNQSDVQHGNQSDVQHGNQSDVQHGNQSDVQHGNQSDVQHGNQSDVQHGNQSDVQHGNQSEPDIHTHSDTVDKTTHEDSSINQHSITNNESEISRNNRSKSSNASLEDNEDPLSHTNNQTDKTPPINPSPPQNNTLPTTNDSTTPPQVMATPTLRATPQSESQTTPITDSWKEMMKQYEEEVEGYEQLSWADRCESPPLSEEYHDLSRETRSPGRAVQLHQKLSSPLRRKSTEQNMKSLEERQVKAEQFRVKKKEEMAQKSKNLSEKIREVQLCRTSMTELKREAMEERLERAEKLRVSHLQEKIRRAQEEDMKVNEIAFINLLEAQNKKIEVLERHQGVVARLQDKEEERQKKIEENQAKEEAAQERRKALEAERIAKLLELDQKRKEQDVKFEQMKQEKEKAREEAAKERERKLEARHTALLLSAEELERKIQIKHVKSSVRYDQHLEHKKGRAQLIPGSRHSSTDYAPCVKAYQKKKWCRVCNVKIVSEVYLLSHLKGKKHKDWLLANGVTEEQEQNDVIILAPENIQRQTVSSEVEERMRAGKKRAKKLRQKMSGRMMRERGEVLMPTVMTTGSRHNQRFVKLIKNTNRVFDTNGGALLHSQTLEKNLIELTRILSTKNKDDQSAFSYLGGLTSLSRLLLLSCDPSSAGRQTIPSIKVLQLTLSVLEYSCTNHSDNSRYMITSNKILPIIDLSHRYFSHPDPRASPKSPPSSSPNPSDTPTSSAHPQLNKSVIVLCGSLFNVLAVIMSSLVLEKKLDEPEFLCVKDCISYVVSVGLVDHLSEYFRSVTGPIEDSGTAHLIISGLNMLLAFTAILHNDVKDVFDLKPHDHTQLISVLKQTELAGTISLLYALLLHDGPPRHSSVPPILPSYILSITAAAIRTINNSSIVGLKVVQNCLGAEGISLEFRHVLGYLLWYCTYHHHEPLLHELILAVGYFSVLNIENQMFLLAGRSPTLLQLLCGLPFEYFSDPKLGDILYPTLISACYNVPESKDVLELEINCKLLCVYLKTKIEDCSKKPPAKDVQDFLSLKYRFPETVWESALQFFT